MTQLYWLCVAALALIAAAILIVAGQTQRVSDVVVVSAFVLIGPLAFVLSAMRLRLLTMNRFVALLSAAIVFVGGWAIWLLIAVNVGAIDP